MEHMIPFAKLVENYFININYVLSPWNIVLNKTAPSHRGTMINRRLPSYEFSADPITSICGVNLGVCNSRKKMPLKPACLLPTPC